VSLPLSGRLTHVKPSPTLAVTARAAELRRQGRDILSLGAGEPDFDTPAHIAAAGIDAIRRGLTRYTSADGTPELKDAVAAKFRRDNGLDYGPSQIIVSCGAKQCLYNLCMAVLGPEDEAVIPAPYWVSYPDMVRLADGVPVILPGGAASGYKITPEQLESALTPRTRLLLLNSPCNPTGAGYSRDELAALGEVLERFPQVTIGTDDIYEHIWWGPEPFCSFATACPRLYERTVTINGVSKAYAMTGWRIGYCAGPAPLIEAMATLQGQSTSNPSSISQHAALIALNGDQSCVHEMTAAYRARHDYSVTAINALPGVRCRPGWGTFYAFADVTDAMRQLGIADDTVLAARLLDEASVATVPGTGFGAPGHLRLSFACSMETLERAFQRIDAFLRSGTARTGSASP
jgi:aspartate aminotransferase